MYILPAKDLYYIIGQPVDPNKGLKAADLKVSYFNQPLGHQ